MGVACALTGRCKEKPAAGGEEWARGPSAKKKSSQHTDIMSNTEGGRNRTSGGTSFVVGLLLLASRAAAQDQFLMPADLDCDLTKIPALLQDINTECTGYATGQCSLDCTLAMAPAMLGDCKYSIRGMIDQSEGGGGSPDGLAQTMDREWTTCLSTNANADVAAAVSVAAGCAGGGPPPPPPSGGGHRRAEGGDESDMANVLAILKGSDDMADVLAILAGNVNPGVTESMAAQQRRRVQQQPQELANEGMLEAFAAGDGSACALVALPPAPAATPYGVQTVPTDPTVQAMFPGYITIRLTVTLDTTQSNVYAMAGTSDSPMSFPPAAGVFGSSLPKDGGFGSWITVGITTGIIPAPPGTPPSMASMYERPSSMGSLGSWSETSGLYETNGAVINNMLNFGEGPGGADIVMAQLIVPDGSPGTATALLQGRSFDGMDWQAVATWSW